MVLRKKSSAKKSLVRASVRAWACCLLLMEDNASYINLIRARRAAYDASLYCKSIV